MGKSAGRLRHFLHVWKELTSDPLILEWVQGYRIPFESPPRQIRVPLSSISESDSKILETMIPQLLLKGVIKRCVPCKEQFVSPVFLDPKPDGGFRFILNLKELNKFLMPPHFKLEDSRTASQLVSPNCFLSTLDLKDAYYLVHVDPTFHKFLRFWFKEKLYEFTCLPFGLCTAPFVFTKMLKPVMHALRSEGLLSVVYLDDFLLIGDTYAQCVSNVAKTSKMLQSLGFLFSTKKCQFPPAQQCKFLSFIFDTCNFTLELPPQRKIAVDKVLKRFRNKKRCTIRSYAQM